MLCRRVETPSKLARVIWVMMWRVLRHHYDQEELLLHTQFSGEATPCPSAGFDAFFSLISTRRKKEPHSSPFSTSSTHFFENHPKMSHLNLYNKSIAYLTPKLGWKSFIDLQLHALKSPQMFRTPRSANFLGAWHIWGLKSKSYYEICIFWSTFN